MFSLRHQSFWNYLTKRDFFVNECSLSVLRFFFFLFQNEGTVDKRAGQDWQGGFCDEQTVWRPHQGTREGKSRFRSEIVRLLICAQQKGLTIDLCYSGTDACQAGTGSHAEGLPGAGTQREARPSGEREASNVRTEVTFDLALSVLWKRWVNGHPFWLECDRFLNSENSEGRWK